jgi:zinc transport system substrate-binding protein
MTVKALLPGIESELCLISPDACPRIQERRRQFELELQELHAEISTLLKAHKGKSIITAHDFLAYFTHEFGLRYEQPVEPIPGKEPSPRDVIRLTRLAKDKNLKFIYSEPQLSQQAVASIAKEAGIGVETLDPIGVSDQIKTYADLIRRNAQQIEKGFSEPR